MQIIEQKGTMQIYIEQDSADVMQMRLGNKMNNRFEFGLVWSHSA